MDDYRIWQDERAGAPVEHCRDKLRHDEMHRIANQQADTRSLMRNRAVVRL